MLKEDNLSNKKDKLLHKLSDVQRAAQEYTTKGRGIIEQWQTAADLAAFNEDFIRLIPDDSFFSPKQWDNQIATWNVFSEHAGPFSVLDEIQKLLISAVSSASLGTSSVISSEYIPLLPKLSQEAARKTYEGYEQFLEQSKLIEKIEIEISRLGLATTIGESESILSLLLQCKQAYQVPSREVVSPSAVLIPLREAINRTLANLLPKRPRQEEAKAPQGKVNSICAQCCKPTIDKRQITQLAQEARDPNNKLSESKQCPMTREQVRELMNRGFVFLHSFLSALDETKMRN